MGQPTKIRRLRNAGEVDRSGCRADSVCAGVVEGSASALLAALTEGSVRAGTEEYPEFGQQVFCRSIMTRVESASEAGS
jgi:hypothetical protein